MGLDIINFAGKRLMTHDADALDRNIDHEDALNRTAAHENNSAARTRLLWRVIALVSIATIGVVAALGIREMFGARDGQAAPSVTYARTLAKEVAPKDVAVPAQAAGADKLIEEPAASEKPSVAEEQRTANLEPSAAAPVSDTAQFSEPARNPPPAFAGRRLPRPRRASTRRKAISSCRSRHTGRSKRRRSISGL